jgi:hypothetical protein
MRRAREAQLARLTTRSTTADDAAAWRSAALRARVKIGAVLRQALAQTGIDPARVAMLRISDEAAQELALIADRPEPPAGATPLTGDRLPDGSAALFETRIDELVRRYRDGQGIDFAGTSVAEALAWCLGRLASSFTP